MNELVNYFKDKGMKNPLRSIELIKRAIKKNSLNLDGLVVFTEAASGEFIYTPIIAAMAGAKKVYAVTYDSSYASKEEVKKDTVLFAELCGVKEKIEVVFNKDNIKYADIVTNLGFVRPIDKQLIENLNPKSVVPYMCEAWEFRRGDVDVKYCFEKNIPVMGTNEDEKGANVFRFSASLIIKLLNEANLEGMNNTIIVLSSDKFGKIIAETLSALNNKIILTNNLDLSIDDDEIIDAVIVCDYTSEKYYFNSEDKFNKLFLEKHPYTTIIQFAGKVDVQHLDSSNIMYYPLIKLDSFRMAKTLAYLGPKPVIDLHCSGLKVGELMFRKKVVLKDSYKVMDELSENNALCQRMIVINEK